MMHLFILFLISSCSFLGKNESFLETVKKKPRSYIAEIPVSSREEALEIIKNRHRYLSLLFTQTYDHHFGAPRWFEECLVANKIGTISTKSEESKLVSELYLDPGFIEGHCPRRRYTWKSSSIYLYCSKQNKLYDIRIQKDETLNLNQKDLCH